MHNELIASKSQSLQEEKEMLWRDLNMDVNTDCR